MKMAFGTRILKCLVGCLFLFLEKFSNFIFRLIYSCDKECIPAIERAILLLPATELSKNIRERKYRCVDVIQAYIKRIQAVNGIVNAVVADRFQAALAEAHDIDTILDNGDIPERYSVQNAPLLGVPFTAKEAFAIEGLPNCSGLVSRVRHVADTDAASVQLLRVAGAIPLAVTNCSELCMWYESANLVYGRTNNAYDTRRMVGGSSGGEGCIISCAGSVIGIGSDIGGSIRMPAFFNGIFGHKPTTGIVPNAGQFPNACDRQQTYLVTGPMCRYACDLMPMYRVMARPNLHRLQLDVKVSVSRLRLYTMSSDGGHPAVSAVHPELVRAQERVISHLERDLGLQVTRVSPRGMRASLDMWSAMMAQSDSPLFRELMEDGGPPLNVLLELGKCAVRRSRHTLPAVSLALTEGLPRRDRAGMERLCRACDDLREEWAGLLADDAVLLYPSHPLPAPYHNQPLFLPFNFAYTAIFNVLGMPVTQCPLGLAESGDSTGLPLGIQLVARQHMDHLTIALAEHLERAFGGWQPPCDVTLPE